MRYVCVLDWDCYVPMSQCTVPASLAGQENDDTVRSAVAGLERDSFVERTTPGLARARATGMVRGRPNALSDKSAATALKTLARERLSPPSIAN